MARTSPSEGFARSVSEDELDRHGGRAAAREVGRASRSWTPLTAACSPTPRSPAPMLRAVENHGGRPRCRVPCAGRARRADAPQRHRGRALLYAAVPIRARGKRGRRSRRLSWRHRSHPGAGARAGAPRRSRGLRCGDRAARARCPLRPRSPALAHRDHGRRPPASAAGDLAARIRVRREDEVGRATRIINQSADAAAAARSPRSRATAARIDAILSAMEDGVLAIDHAGRGDCWPTSQPDASSCGSHRLARAPLPEVDPPARGGERSSRTC